MSCAPALSSADLLTDLKSGYLLGANPRKQFLAQFAGIFVGTLVTCLSFAVLVPNAEALGGKQFPAPAAQTWSAVAQALGKGLSALEPLKVWLIVLGSAVVGLLVGLTGAGGGALMTPMLILLFNVKPSDPATILSVAAFIACVALVACYLPASRATRVDPMVVLRDE